MANLLDAFINEEADKAALEGKSGDGGKTSSISALRRLCNIFIVAAYVLLVPSVGFMIAFLGASSYNSSKEMYLMTGVCGLAGCVSLLFYGYVGKCLDDIRSNTKK